MQKVGGGGQPLSYTNPNAYEPSFREGSDLLGSSTVRPGIPIKGGFVPSVMGNFVQNVPLLVPLVTTAAYRMMSNKTKKMRGGVKDWETLRYEAKRDLSAIGKASAVNINRLASIRKRGESNAAFIEDFTARKGEIPVEQAPVNNVLTSLPKEIKVKKAKKTVTIKSPPGAATSKWQQNKQRAKNYLSRLGKPSGPNIAAYASMLRKGQNTSEFLNEFQTRVPKVKAKAEPKPKAPVVVRPPSARAPLAAPARAIAESLAKIKSRIAKQKEQEPEPSLLPLPQNPTNGTTQKKKRVLGPKGLTLKENRQRAKEFLLQHGKPSGKNIIKFTSIRRKANAQAENEFLTTFKSRFLEKPVVQNEENEVVEVVEKPLPLPLPLQEAPAPAQAAAKKSRVTSSASIDQWKLNKQRAKELLDRIGSATAAEVSKLASMMRKGSDTSEFITSIQSRVNQTRKRLTMLKQKKDLSAVQEVNNENNVEEYSLPNNSAKPLLNNSSRNVEPSGLEESSTYRPPPFVATNTRKNGKVPVENFRKHLQLLKQKLQREKV
jgi:hypothetical protein